MLTKYPHGPPIPLANWLLRRYWVLPHLDHQQYGIHLTNTMRQDDRIATICQLYIQPFIRGNFGQGKSKPGLA